MPDNADGGLLGLPAVPAFVRPFCHATEHLSTLDFRQFWPLSRIVERVLMECVRTIFGIRKELYNSRLTDCRKSCITHPSDTRTTTTHGASHDDSL